MHLDLSVCLYGCPDASLKNYCYDRLDFFTQDVLTVHKFGV